MEGGWQLTWNQFQKVESSIGTEAKQCTAVASSCRKMYFNHLKKKSI